MGSTRGRFTTLLAALLTMLIALAAIPVNAADDNVNWNELGHNSRDSLYRNPSGAVPTGTPVTLRLRALDGDLTAATVRVWNDRVDAQSFYPMTKVASAVVFNGNATPYEFWEVTLPTSSLPTVYWYRFIVQDGTSTAYYEDDASRDGGYGQTFSDSPDYSWQLTFYDPSFQTPDWVKNAVVYQIFPDRFRDGNPANNPTAGGFFYGANDTIVRSNSASGYWNTYICDPRNVGTGSCPNRYSQNFYGGDLLGITQKLDYLQSLGVTAIYLNPIFESPSNHKYDTTDFMKIDNNFGDLAIFQDLVTQANSRGMRIILDGVFNHSSSDSIYFDRYSRWNASGTASAPGVNDGSGACENVNSPYADWYTFFPYAGGGTAPCSNNRDYPKWFGIFDSLPVLQTDYDLVEDNNPTDNQEVLNYFLNQGTNSVAPYWMQWADGWRLDVAPEIDHGQLGDPNDIYMERLRQVVHAVNPDAYIVGEEWGNATSWVIGGEWDATMNYQFSSAILSFWRDEPFSDNDHNGGSSAGILNPLSPTQVNARLLNLEERYPEEALYAMMNLFGSHDTSRALFMLDHNTDLNNTSLYYNPNYNWSDAVSRLRGAVFMQMTLPGAPTIYYGDEVGTVSPPTFDGSQWQDDPYNRVPYPWLDAGGTPYYAHMSSQFQRNLLLSHYSRLTNIRNTTPALRTGSFDPLYMDDANEIYVYGRKLADESQTAIIVVNGSNVSKTVTFDASSYVPAGASLTTVFTSSGTIPVAANGTITVNPSARSGNILIFGAISNRPAVVTNLQAISAANQVLLSWNASANANSYDIYRSRLWGGGYELVGTTGSTNFADTTVQNALKYYYVVVAKNTTTLLESAYSAEVDATPALTIGFTNLQWPPSIDYTLNLTQPTENIYGQIWINGVTDQPGQAPGIMAQVGFGDSQNVNDGSWVWFDMSYNTDSGNNDEYVGQLQPNELGSYFYTTRFSTDGGTTFTYAQQGPNGNPNPFGALSVNSSGDTTPPSVPTGLEILATTSGSVTLGWDSHPNADADLYGFNIYRRPTITDVASTSLAVAGYTLIDTVADPAADQYLDDTVTADASYDYVITAMDVSANESTESNSVTAVAERREVDVTFRVTVPDYTPGVIHIVGAFNGWNPSDPAFQMTQVSTSPNIWEIHMLVLDETTFPYKYTRGNWETVEKQADGGAEIPDRQFQASYGTTGQQLVEATVANWRDPLVVEVQPADDFATAGADTVVNVRWNQNMPADISAQFNFRDSTNTAVAGALGYDGTTFTHSFTPTNPLADGLYTLAITGTNDAAGGDAQQVPFASSFTVNEAISTEQVTFSVTVPSHTPDGSLVYVAGDFHNFAGSPYPEWTPDGIALTNVSGDLWEVTLNLPAGQTFNYKYTRGSWETVEKEADGNTDILGGGNRQHTVVNGGGTQTDTVANWRDPYVVSISPVDTATNVASDTSVVVEWNQAVADISDTFVLSNGSTVAGSFNYDGVVTHTFTPSNPLGAGAYTVSITGESDTNNDTQQVAFNSGFEVGGVQGEPVTFSVFVPSHTPSPVFLVGSFGDFTGSIYPSWDPAGIAMTDMGGNVWEVTLSLPEGDTFQYKYTRGSWETVEKEADGNSEILGGANRTVVVPNGGTTLDDSVDNWRDPYVVSVSPTDGSIAVDATSNVTITWNQSVPDSVPLTVSDTGGAVAGVLSYDNGTFTHTFNPDTDLPDAQYTVAVTGVTDPNGDVQQLPFSSDFFVGIPNGELVTFSVTVPSHTPTDVFLVGDFHNFAGSPYPEWNPGGIAMTNTGGNVWEVTLTLPEAQTFSYKYTRGSWETVEKEADGNAEILGGANRQVTVANGGQTVNDTVQNWRDPYIVSVTPVDNATSVDATTNVAVTWNQTMPADISAFFTLVNGGVVSGSMSYDNGTFTHTFNPTDDLSTQTYTVTVAGSMDTNGDAQQVTFTSDFSVQGITNVTFSVTVPSHTPSAIFIAGDLHNFTGSPYPEWDPSGIALTDMGGNVWEVTLSLPANQTFNYKYTRGSWETVEKEADGNSDILGGSNRQIIVPVSNTTQNDSVANWRDPYVVSVSPADATSGVAVDTTIAIVWNQSMPETPAGFSLEDASAASVAGTFSYDNGTFTHTFTPDADLTTGAYFVDVIGANDAGGDSQQLPFSSTFDAQGSSDVTFSVTVPSHTPSSSTIYLMGDFGDTSKFPGSPYPNFDPAGIAMTDMGSNVWEVTLTLPDTITFDYLYTRGSEETVEKAANGNSDILGGANRQVSVPTGGTTLNDSVANWRDPYVVSVNPVDGAVDIAENATVQITWNQAMPADISSFFSLANGGAVAGSFDYDTNTFTHTFTPNAELSTNTYTVSVGSALDVNNDPQQVAFSSSFAVLGDSDVTFSVTVPSHSPVGSSIFIRGDFHTFAGSPYPDAPIAMTDMGSNVWAVTLTLLDGQTFDYNYSRGSAETRETQADGNTAATVRQVTAPSAAINDTVANWIDPYVVSVSPANNATGVSAGTSVLITWNQALTDMSDTFSLLDGSNNPVAGSFGYDTGTFTHTFTPDNPLSTGTYTVGITGEADDNGDFQQISFSSSFSVQAYANVLFRATVPSHTPAGSSIELVGNFDNFAGSPYPNDGIVMTNVSGNIWEVTLSLPETFAFQFRYSRGSDATLERQADGNSITNRNFTVPVGGGTRAGTVLNWRDPYVVSVSPASDATGLAPDTTASITWNQAMPADISSFFSLLDPDTNPVAGSLSYDSGTFTHTFTPASDLSTGLHTIQVNQGLGDAVSDGTLQALYNSDFTVQGSSNITFSVTVPNHTPNGGSIFLRGDFHTFAGSPYPDAPIAMTAMGSDVWQVSLNLPDNATFNYNYSRGTAETMETAADGNTAASVRQVVVPIGGTTQNDTVANWLDPYVVSVSPANAATGVSTSSTVMVTWNQAITDISDTFSLLDGSNNPVLGSFAYDNGTFTHTFTPTNPLTTGTYNLSITGETDDNGDAQQVSFASSFSTQGFANVLFRATVPSHTPVGSTIEIVGNFDGFAGSPYPNNGIVMTDMGGNLWEVTLSLPETQTFNFHYSRGSDTTRERQLDGNTNVTRAITVPIGGTTMARTIQNWRDPYVLSVVPVNNATGVSPSTTVAITWNQDMPTNLTGFSLTNGGTVTGTFSFDAGTNVTTFTPDSDLTTGTYNVSISGASDVASDVQQVAFNSSFEVQGTSDVLFSVTVPSHTPNAVFLRGDFHTFAGSPYPDAPMAMTDMGNDVWEVILTLPDNGTFNYNYNRNSDATLETAADGNTAASVRQVLVPIGGITQTDSVANWLDPYVLSVLPVNNATGVDENTVVEVVWNQDMPSDLTGFFSLTDNIGDPVAGTFSFDAGTNTSTFTPDAVLSSGQHTVTILGANDVNSDVQQVPFLSSFVVRQLVDVTFSVTVPSLSPGTINIEGNFDNFSNSPYTTAPMAMTDMGGSVWAITLTLPEDQAFDYNYSRGTASTLERQSDGNTAVSRQVTVADAGGATQSVNDTVVNWRDPMVVNSGPADGSTDVAPATHVILQWNQTMPTNLAGFSFIGPDGAVAGSFSFDAGTNTHTFDSTNPLTAGTYTVMVSGAVDTVGDSQVVDHQFSFDVSVLALPIVPQVDGVAPTVNTTVGLFVEGLFYTHDLRGTQRTASATDLGHLGSQFFVGDWNGDGVGGFGFYNNRNVELYESTPTGFQSYNFALNVADGIAWQVFAGDSNADGKTDLAVYGSGSFFFDLNLNGSIETILAYDPFGDGSGTPFMVDWDNNGSANAGLYKDGVWHIRNLASPFNFGPAEAGWTPIVGDWDGDGVDSVGLFKDGLWRLTNSISVPNVDFGFTFGTTGIPVAGFTGGDSFTIHGVIVPSVPTGPMPEPTDAPSDDSGAATPPPAPGALPPRG